MWVRKRTVVSLPDSPKNTRQTCKNEKVVVVDVSDNLLFRGPVLLGFILLGSFPAPHVDQPVSTVHPRVHHLTL